MKFQLAFCPICGERTPATVEKYPRTTLGQSVFKNAHCWNIVFDHCNSHFTIRQRVKPVYVEASQ